MLKLVVLQIAVMLIYSTPLFADDHVDLLFGPNADWTPDHLTANLKLHGPYNIIIEAEIKNGQIKNLKIAPPQREADIIFPK